jgi:hypothetical protein
VCVWEWAFVLSCAFTNATKAANSRDRHHHSRSSARLGPATKASRAPLAKTNRFAGQGLHTLVGPLPIRGRTFRSGGGRELPKERCTKLFANR